MKDTRHAPAGTQFIQLGSLEMSTLETIKGKVTHEC